MTIGLSRPNITERSSNVLVNFPLKFSQNLYKTVKISKISTNDTSLNNSMVLFSINLTKFNRDSLVCCMSLKIIHFNLNFKALVKLPNQKR